MQRQTILLLQMQAQSGAAEFNAGLGHTQHSSVLGLLQPPEMKASHEVEGQAKTISPDLRAGFYLLLVLSECSFSSDRGGINSRIQWINPAQSLLCVCILILKQ